MKITICSYDSPGNIDGPTSWMKRLLPYLRDNGIETRIIFFAANTKDLPAYNYFTRLGFTCKLIYWEKFNEEKIVEILQDVKEFPPDIFIPNYFPAACYASKWIKQSGIPTVCILHNDDDFHLKLIDVFASDNEQYNVSAIVGVSKMLTEIIKKKISQNVRVEFLPYGAPVPQSKSILQENDNLKLVYIGRMMEKQKRISDVAKAFCSVAKEIPGTECVLYGSGEDLSNVLAIINKDGKGLPVKYGGNLETSEVQQHLQQNHVFVLLSDYEGLPISLMEAMACGLVPVCSNIRSGMQELITQNETGFLVDDRDSSFINTIKKIKSDYKLWQKISLAARQKIVTEYAEDICNKKWLTFFNSLAAPKKTIQPIQIPDLSVLRALHYPVQFNRSGKAMPAGILVPAYKLKSWAGKMKRKILK